VSGFGWEYETVNVPVRVPPEVGVNQTLNAQLLPVLKINSPTQDSASVEKSPVIVKIGTPSSPALRRVIVWAGLITPTAWPPNVRLVGESIGGPTNAVPISCTVWELLTASSVTVR
jgi:hypothetical protein